MSSVKFLKISFIAVSLVCLFTTCTRFVADPDACYNDKVKKLIITNCTSSGCHNPTDKESGYDFTTYEGVMNAVKAGHSGQSELYKVINSKGEGRMPPAYSLKQDEKDLIKHWINNGGLNNSCTVEICDSSQFTYTKVSIILKENCVNCHSKSNSSGGILLDSHANVYACEKNGGKLLACIKHQQGYIPMPEFTTQLSTCDIRIIEKWVKAGMPNN